jgi:uncharacterized membrane protein
MPSHHKSRVFSIGISCTGRVLTVSFGLALPPCVAHAEFSVCNQSFDVVNVAIGYDTADPGAPEALYITVGWWTIGPNQCANVIRDPLTSRYIYVHAQDVFGQAVLPGSRDMCIEPEKFRIEGIADCWARGLITAQFQQIDTQTTERWTLFLAPSP